MWNSNSNEAPPERDRHVEPDARLCRSQPSLPFRAGDHRRRGARSGARRPPGGGWLVAIEELTAFGPRAFYFLYLLALLLLAVALVRWPWLAGALLILALVDFGWGVGSYAFGHPLGAASLLPPHQAEPPRFQWHALLQVVPMPSLHFISPTGLAISHTSEGTRGREPAPHSSRTRNVVAIFGGSTTYDIGAGEGDTWSDRLAAALEQGDGNGASSSSITACRATRRSST